MRPSMAVRLVDVRDTGQNWFSLAAAVNLNQSLCFNMIAFAA